jgi:hypothetical protein
MKITKAEARYIIKHRIHAQDDLEIKQKIADFFKGNPNPKDEDQIHSLALELNIDTHKFEETIYSMLGSFFGKGRSIEFEGTYDEKQIKMGMKVEMEHTDCEIIARKIAMDHLSEFPDYYTKLAAMEKDAGVEE